MNFATKKIPSLIQSITFVFFLVLPNVSAQTADQEATTGILRGIFGDLPSACSDATSSTCIYCLGYVKLLPLAFFFGLFYLIFTYGIRLIVRGQPLGSIPSVQVGIVLISIALSIFTLQSGAVGGALSRIASFRGWIDGLIWLIGIGLLAYLAFRIMNAVRLTPTIGGHPITVLVITIVTFVLLAFFAGFAAPLAGVGNLTIFLLMISLIFIFTVGTFFLTGLFGLIFGGLALASLIALIALGIWGPLDFLPLVFSESESFALGICA